MNTVKPNTWWLADAKAIDNNALEEARQHQAQLTKPPGSLGRLETIVEQFAGWQGCAHPRIENIRVTVFAGDHGICAKGVSAFPQQVTGQMIDNFVAGGAAVCVLSRALGASFAILNLGTVTPMPDRGPLKNIQVMAGTEDFSEAPAMSDNQVLAALDAGREHMLNASTVSAPPELFIGGEMGIGNTTSAAALYAALLDINPREVVGAGTGVDRDTVAKKAQLIDQALSLHRSSISDPLECLRCLGGLEIAALVGGYIAAAQAGIPILVDGFICSAAALVAMKINPSVTQWMLFSHCSAENAHALVLDKMGVSPLLNLDMRLGEGSGALMAAPILINALRLHNDMATFTQAGVSGSEVL